MPQQPAGLPILSVGIKWREKDEKLDDLPFPLSLYSFTFLHNKQSVSTAAEWAIALNPSKLKLMIALG